MFGKWLLILQSLCLICLKAFLQTNILDWLAKWRQQLLHQAKTPALLNSLSHHVLYLCFAK